MTTLAPHFALLASLSANDIKEIVLAALTLASALVALWQNRGKTTAQKVNTTLIQSVEALASLPQTRGTETIVKAAIQARAELDDVQHLLAPLVEKLTTPLPDSTEMNLRAMTAQKVAQKLEDAAAQQAADDAGAARS